MSSCKEEGNEWFKSGEFKKAKISYTKALEQENIGQEDKAILFMNRAACALKLDEFQQCVDDCTDALNINPTLEKALYRRAEAYSRLEKFPQAFKDARQVVSLNPRNSTAVALARRLKETILQRQSSGSSGVSQVLKAIETDVDSLTTELKQLAIQTSTNRSIATQVMDNGGVSLLWKTFLSGIESSNSTKQQAVYVLEALATHDAAQVLEYCISNVLVEFVATAETTELKTSGVKLLAHLLSIATDGHLSTVFLSGLKTGMDPTNVESVHAAAIDGLVKFCTSKERALEMIDFGLLDAAVEIADTLSSSISARLSMFFSQVFSQLDDDEMVKEKLQQAVLTTLSSIYGNSSSPSIEKYTKAIGALSAVFLVNRDVGLWAVQRPNCFINIHTLLTLNENEKAQTIAMDVMTQIATMEKGRGLFSEECFHDIAALMHATSIRIRAGAVTTYVKLCAVSKQFKGESVSGKLVLQAVVEILEYCNTLSQVNFSPKERAVEALSYIIHDTAVKESVVRHSGAMKALCAVSEHEKTTVAYGVGHILAHVMASEGQLRKRKMAGMDMTPEQYEQLQRALKQESAFEDGDHEQKVTFRISKVVEYGGIRVLCLLSKLNNSPRTQESAAQSLLHAADNVSVRGKMIQQGCIAALLPLSSALERSKAEKEKETYTNIQKYASQALAKLLITTNPALVQSSQLLSTIKPLITNLLSSNENLLEFEGLMALTNIASAGEDAKERILAEKALSTIQYLQFSDHELVRRAATEMMCNLLPHQQVVDMICQKDKIRLWMAFAQQQEDFELSRAASGALAMLAQLPEPCDLMLDNDALRIFATLLKTDKTELQHRAAFTLNCFASCEKGKHLLKEMIPDVLTRLKALEKESRDEQVKEACRIAQSTIKN